MQTNPTIATVTLSANSEGSYALPANTVRFTIKVRAQNLLLRIAWVSGDTGSNYITIPQNGSYSTAIKARNTTFTIFLLTASGSTVEIESWQN